VGVFDPLDELKPLLKSAGVDYADLEESGWTNYTGPLIIVGPFAGGTKASASLEEKIKAAAKGGVAVVWIQPPPARCRSSNPFSTRCGWAPERLLLFPQSRCGSQSARSAS